MNGQSSLTFDFMSSPLLHLFMTSDRFYYSNLGPSLRIWAKNDIVSPFLSLFMLFYYRPAKKQISTNVIYCSLIECPTNSLHCFAELIPFVVHLSFLSNLFLYEYPFFTQRDIKYHCYYKPKCFGCVVPLQMFDSIDSTHIIDWTRWKSILD